MPVPPSPDPPAGPHQVPEAAQPGGGQRLIRSPRGQPFRVVGRAGPVDRQGAPPVRAEAREELLVVKQGEVFLCARPDGDVSANRISGEGLYAHDTRYLSEIRLQVGERAPVALSYSSRGARAVVDSTNADLPRPSAAPVPQLSLSITRELTVAAGRLYYLLRVHNFLGEALDLPVSMALAADFADMFEVRGGVHRSVRGHALAPRQLPDGFVLAYLGEDDAFRESVVEFDPRPERAELDSHRARGRWQLALAPGEERCILMTVEPSLAGARSRRRGLRPATAQLARDDERWRGACTSIHTDNELFNGLLSTAASDLQALTTPAPHGRILSAGIPWYVAVFGRDALVAAGEALILNRALAREALWVLAGLQAGDDDPWRDAEPGKIAHELRLGELARAGIVPHSPYYGTVDATPLFLILAAEYHAWTADVETLQELRPALDAALGWIDRHGDRDGDGFIEYERRSPGGLVNQGWKDSHDAIVHADGRLAEGPIALVEAQGYVYQAKCGIADVYAALGDGDLADQLRAQARTLRIAFNEAFWNPQEGTFALALDGHKRQVASVASNPGHCLLAGIVERDKAAQLAERLMAPDMFCGWGMRTLSSQSPAYNPMSYHNGSIWPHDNAIIAAGLKRYGHDEAVLRIATALFEVAASARDFRLPELYCGFGRAQRDSVVAYPVACIPQAWAAAAPLLLLQTMLGLRADAPGRSLRLERPALPEWLRRVRLEGVRVGHGEATLEFDRDGGATRSSLLAQQGELRVTMSTGTPSDHPTDAR